MEVKERETVMDTDMKSSQSESASIKHRVGGSMFTPTQVYSLCHEPLWNNYIIIATLTTFFPHDSPPPPILPLLTFMGATFSQSRLEPNSRDIFVV